MFNYLLINENEDFTLEDISSLLCEAQKFGTISFILFRSLDHYSRNSSEKFIDQIKKNLIESTLLTNQQVLQLKNSLAEKCKFPENKIFVTETNSDIRSFIKLNPLFFLAFLTENNSITHVFMYTEINQELDLVIDYIDSSKFRIREYLNKIRHELNKNISLSEEDYYACFHD